MERGSINRRVAWLGVIAVLATGFAVAGRATPAQAFAVPGSAYRQVNLASDVPGMALVQDPLLVDPWGLALNGSSAFYLANSGTSTSALYRTGTAGSIVRHATVPTISIPGGLPTGVVANPGTGFKISSGGSVQPARFLYASITGNIVGWHENVPPGNRAGRIAKSLPGHVYTGLAYANNGTDHLYAADFANGQIDVFDSSFVQQGSGAFPFADPTIPSSQGNTFHPYNIQAIGGSLYVTYAKVGADGTALAGIGNGFVRRFNTNGVRDLTFGISNGALNSPWGLALAPASYGIFGGALLVGNAGTGNAAIHAYNPTTGAPLGTLSDDNGAGLVIDDLHGIAFGNGSSGGDPNTLYFVAGLGSEEHGLFGALTANTSTATSGAQFSASNIVTNESAGSIQVTVTRDGDVSSAASVRYATWDESKAGHATQKNDYQINVGTLALPAGQTSASFTVLIGDDKYVEGAEVLGLALSNPKGVELVGNRRATITINDNDVSPPSSNPLDTNAFFVYRQYLDFFNRVPDAGGAAHWKKKLDDCGADTACLKTQRVAVSAAFFLSSEFQNGMSLAYRVRKTMTATPPLYGELMLYNTVRRSSGSSGLYALAAADPEFVARTSSSTNAQYVDKLIANSGGSFTASQRSALINGLNGATKTRASVLGEVASNSTVQSVVFRPAFVMMQFAGYLRRDADTAGYNYWLNRLNTYNGDYVKAGMVASFVVSSEYRNRFGPA